MHQETSHAPINKAEGCNPSNRSHSGFSRFDQFDDTSNGLYSDYPPYPGNVPYLGDENEAPVAIKHGGEFLFTDLCI
jgi:hypothetical protein